MLRHSHDVLVYVVAKISKSFPRHSYVILQPQYVVPLTYVHRSLDIATSFQTYHVVVTAYYFVRTTQLRRGNIRRRPRDIATSTHVVLTAS